MPWLRAAKQGSVTPHDPTDRATPRTAAGRALLAALNDESCSLYDEGCHAADMARAEKFVPRIEAEAALLRPRWHHSPNMPPDDPHFCEDCDELRLRAQRAEAAVATLDFDAMRVAREWPTPMHMHRIADALDAITPAKYGDVLRWFADRCDEWVWHMDDTAAAERLAAVQEPQP